MLKDAHEEGPNSTPKLEATADFIARQQEFSGYVLEATEFCKQVTAMNETVDALGLKPEQSEMVRDAIGLPTPRRQE